MTKFYCFWTSIFFSMILLPHRGVLQPLELASSGSLTIIGHPKLTLKEALDKISPYFKINIAYEKGELDLNSPARFEMDKSLSADENLKLLLEPYGLFVTRINHTTYIITAGTKSTEKNQLSSAHEKPDSIKVSIPVKNDTLAASPVQGKIIDASGQPMPGVNIVEKGTTHGTTADADGKYTLHVGGGAVLIFSFIGYITKETAVGNRSVIDMTMDPDIKVLDEIAIVGFGEQRKISLVGAQSTIKAEDLKVPVSNINTLLAGRISGIIGVQRTGQPGRSNADIWIRGISSFGSGNSTAPLILVDGVERPLTTIDPQDIATFTILKDAAGTAVYGVRGANGVMLVTTKKGAPHKPQITLDYSEGVTSLVKRPEMADAKTYMEACNESLTTRGEKARYNPDYINKTLSGEDPYIYPNVDWFKTLFKDYGSVRRSNINVNGGTEFLRYYGSVSYYDETGLLNLDNFKKYNTDLRYRRVSAMSNVDVNITKTTEFSIHIRGAFSTQNRPYKSTDDIFYTAMVTPPTDLPIEYPGGLIPAQNASGSNPNPWAEMNRRGYTTDFTNSLYSNLQLTQKLDFVVKGLKAVGMFSFDSNNGVTISRSKKEPTYYYAAEKPRNEDGSLNLFLTNPGDGIYLGYYRENTGNRRFYTQSSLNYDGKFGVHRLGGLALFYSDDKMDQQAGNFTSSIPERYIGLAGRLTYSYDERYFAEGNLGFNGSELFAPENRYGTFPAYGVGWVVSNEKFFAPINKFIPYLKLRYTDGQTGIGSTGNRRFAYLTLLADGQTGYSYGKDYSGTSGISITDYASNIIWSKSRKQDVGVEIKVNENHLSLIVDFFREQRTGIFLQRSTLPKYLGLTNNPWGNVGEVENKGIDGTLLYTNEIGKVNISLQGNLTFNRNKVISNDQPTPQYAWKSSIGESITARFGYVAEGLFKSQEEINNSAVPGDKSTVLPGDIKFKDLNGDGKINWDDAPIIGRGDIPYLVYGFGFNIGYKGFNLGATVTGQKGAQMIIGYVGVWPFGDQRGYTNVYSNITDRWQEGKNNDQVFYPRLANGRPKNENNIPGSTWWQKSADIIRVKTLELNYRFPEKIFKGAFKAATMYIQMVNPVSFQNFELWDVETAKTNGAVYPNIKSYSLGVQINF